MTNKEIREQYFEPQYISSKYYLDKLEPLQESTRKDEREKVIGEIENWLNINGVDDYGNTQDYRDDLYCKLNSLKQ